MTPLTTLLTALSSLGANKLRAILTLLGIIIGVAAVISLMSIGRGAQEMNTAAISSITPKTSRKLFRIYRDILGPPQNKN